MPNVAGRITPDGDAGIFALAFAEHLRGGLHVVFDITARDAIPADRRLEGMEVKVLVEGAKYTLTGGITNADWVEADTSGLPDGGSVNKILTHDGTDPAWTDSPILAGSTIRNIAADNSLTKPVQIFDRGVTAKGRVALIRSDTSERSAFRWSALSLGVNANWSSDGTIAYSLDDVGTPKHVIQMEYDYSGGGGEVTLNTGTDVFTIVPGEAVSSIVAGLVTTSTPHGLAVDSSFHFPTLVSPTGGVATGITYYVLTAPSPTTFTYALTHGGAPTTGHGAASGTTSGESVFANDQHGMILGDAVFVFSTETNPTVGGVELGQATAYYVWDSTGGTTFKLASSRANAVAGIGLNFDGAGTGTIKVLMGMHEVNWTTGGARHFNWVSQTADPSRASMIFSSPLIVQVATSSTNDKYLADGTGIYSYNGITVDRALTVGGQHMAFVGAGQRTSYIHYSTNGDWYIRPALAAGKIVIDDSATAKVVIGGATPDADAILDLQSTTKGFLPPRMTTGQRDAIVTPPAGLEIFNTTTAKKNLYSGSAWEAVTSA